MIIKQMSDIMLYYRYSANNKVDNRHTFTRTMSALIETAPQLPTLGELIIEMIEWAGLDTVICAAVALLFMTCVAALAYYRPRTILRVTRDTSTAVLNRLWGIGYHLLRLAVPGRPAPIGGGEDEWVLIELVGGIDNKKIAVEIERLTKTLEKFEVMICCSDCALLSETDTPDSEYVLLLRSDVSAKTIKNLLHWFNDGHVRRVMISWPVLFCARRWSHRGQYVLSRLRATTRDLHEVMTTADGWVNKPMALLRWISQKKAELWNWLQQRRGVVGVDYYVNPALTADYSKPLEPMVQEPVETDATLSASPESLLLESLLSSGASVGDPIIYCQFQAPKETDQQADDPPAGRGGDRTEADDTSVDAQFSVDIKLIVDLDGPCEQSDFADFRKAAARAFAPLGNTNLRPLGEILPAWRTRFLYKQIVHGTPRSRPSTGPVSDITSNKSPVIPVNGELLIYFVAVDTNERDGDESDLPAVTSGAPKDTEDRNR